MDAVTHPDTLGCLLSAPLVIHRLEFSVEESVEECGLTTTLAANDRDDRVVALELVKILVSEVLLELFAAKTAVRKGE